MLIFPATQVNKEEEQRKKNPCVRKSVPIFVFTHTGILEHTHIFTYIYIEYFRKDTYESENI